MNDKPQTQNKPVKSKYRKLWIALLLLLLLVVLIYCYSYFFAKDSSKVIYQDDTRRIYLNEKKEYKKGREMWRMVYEDRKTGNRFFVLGNSLKGFKNEKMAKIVLNTIDQGKTRSFDQVERAGITMNAAKTDIHHNLIEKTKVIDFENDFPELTTP